MLPAEPASALHGGGVLASAVCLPPRVATWGVRVRSLATRTLMCSGAPAADVCDSRAYAVTHQVTATLIGRATDPPGTRASGMAGRVRGVGRGGGQGDAGGGDQSATLGSMGWSEGTRPLCGGGERAFAIGVRRRCVSWGNRALVGGKLARWCDRSGRDSPGDFRAFRGGVAVVCWFALGSEIRALVAWKFALGCDSPAILGSWKFALWCDSAAVVCWFARSWVRRWWWVVWCALGRGKFARLWIWRFSSYARMVWGVGICALAVGKCGFGAERRKLTGPAEA
jgi:hypothetical protein